MYRRERCWWLPALPQPWFGSARRVGGGTAGQCRGGEQRAGQPGTGEQPGGAGTGAALGSGEVGTTAGHQAAEDEAGVPGAGVPLKHGSGRELRTLPRRELCLNWGKAQPCLPLGIPVLATQLPLLSSQTGVPHGDLPEHQPRAGQLNSQRSLTFIPAQNQHGDFLQTLWAG